MWHLLGEVVFIDRFTPNKAKIAFPPNETCFEYCVLIERVSFLWLGWWRLVGMLLVGYFLGFMTANMD